MHHKTATPQTAGRVLHRARWYDLFGRVISFGRDKAIREKLVELAARRWAAARCTASTPLLR
jgi:ubiquinone/menaquinone biosynthesis C-methylase UbiE